MLQLRIFGREVVPLPPEIILNDGSSYNNCMNKPALLACLALLFFTRPAWTEPSNTPPSNATEDQQTEERQRPAEERLTPEARRRLRDTLNNFSRAYPDREQMEERRRLMHDRMEERLNNADKSGGVGSITRSEAQLRMPRLARQFDQIDTNGDNVITREEIQAARERAAMEKRETARIESSGIESRPTKSQ